MALVAALDAIIDPLFDEICKEVGDDDDRRDESGDDNDRRDESGEDGDRIDESGNDDDCGGNGGGAIIACVEYDVVKDDERFAWLGAWLKE